MRSELISGGLLGGLAAAAIVAAPAYGQNIVSPENWSGYADFRAATADGDQSWLKGGYGKARYGGDRDGDTAARLQLAEAGLVWHPRFTQWLGAVMNLEYEPGAHNAIDIVESYLALKTPGDWGISGSARAGVFYPPVSLEHDAFAWTVNHSITPSAIDTWIGEEVKVAGIEGTLRHELGPGDLSVTLSAFGGDDTAGTLIAFRGWALHDVESGVFGRFPIPAVAPMRQAFFSFQDPYTKSMDEIDGRAGYYGQIAYDGPNSLQLRALHYDNNGDPTALDGMQWAWSTQFSNFGVGLKPTPHTTVLAQYLTGETRTGWSAPPRAIYADFSSYYILGAWDFGFAEATARFDSFTVDDKTFLALDNENETGTALTFALGRRMSRHFLGRVELMQIESDRPQRADAGLDPKDRETVMQTSLRYDF